MGKYYVLFPVRVYDGSAELEGFDSKREALKAINDDLKIEHDLQADFSEYRIIKGIELSLKEKTTVVEVTIEGEN